MKLTVLGFGIAKDIFGRSSVVIELHADANVQDLKKQLEDQYPRLQQLASYMVAVNNEYAKNEVRLQVADEIAIIPPVSGG